MFSHVGLGRCSRGVFALTGWCLLASSAAAADREVRLRISAPIARDIPAFPRIADPVDDAERKVNLSLDELDRTVRKGADECRLASKGRASWERMFSVPVTAPGFLSFHFIDNVFCGGAHPSYGTFSIVYDLRSGAPADWTKLLPPALTGQVAWSETSDGQRVVTLSSARLHQLYLTRYRPRTGSVDPDDEECRKAVAMTRNGKPPLMKVWFKSREGLAVQFDLEHAIHTCSDEVTIPVRTLKAEGASVELVRALEAARPAQLR